MSLTLVFGCNICRKCATIEPRSLREAQGKKHDLKIKNTHFSKQLLQMRCIAQKDSFKRM